MTVIPRPKTVADRKAEFDATIKPIERYSPIWEARANRVARQFVQIVSCNKCNSPTIKGYICTYCGDSNPTMSWEQEQKWAEKYGE